MREFIITDKQLGLIRDFATVSVDGDKLEEIVRCRGCAKLDRSQESERCAGWYWCPSTSRHTPPDGFCVWGE